MNLQQITFIPPQNQILSLTFIILFEIVSFKFASQNYAIAVLEYVNCLPNSLYSFCYQNEQVKRQIRYKQNTEL